MPRAEVYALLADLLRLSPGYRQSPERDMRKQSLVALALEADPDLLATYAIVLADSGRCAERQGYVQRSIDLLPGAAPSAALSALKSTRKSIGEHCLKHPVRQDGKALEIRWKVEFDVHK